MVIKGEHGKRIDRLISQSYDSDPKVRMNVVSELSTITEHPGAVFALLELASDKDEGIKNAAQAALSKVKQRDDVGSIQKLFQQSETEHIESEVQVRERLMPSIDKLFTNKATKKRLMSSLEKFFSERKKHHEARAETAIQDGAGQTALKDHLEVISQVDSIGEFASRKKGGQAEVKKEEQEIPEEAESLALPEISSKPKLAAAPQAAARENDVPSVFKPASSPAIPAHEEAPEAISREIPEDIPEPRQPGNL